MNIENEIGHLIGTPESETLEYKAVLPPSKNIAQLICSFANSKEVISYLVFRITMK
jgi:predicted HTH transcriptional regulator